MSTTVATLTGSGTAISDEELDELRMQVRGPVAAGAEAAGAARPVFNAMHPGNPALTVGCTSTASLVMMKTTHG